MDNINYSEVEDGRREWYETVEVSSEEYSQYVNESRNAMVEAIKERQGNTLKSEILQLFDMATERRAFAMRELGIPIPLTFNLEAELFYIKVCREVVEILGERNNG